MKLFNTRSILFTIFAITASTFTLWLYILLGYNPFETDSITFSTFYITLLIYLGGLFTFLIYYWKIKISNHELIYENIFSSLRQGYILSLIIVISLILKGLTIFNWFEFIIILTIGMIAELYFKSKNVRKLSSNN